jgi:predicted SpoU family rRNA methylase
MNNMKTSMAFVITMTLVNCFFSINLLKSNSEHYFEEITNLTEQKLEVEKELNEFLKYGIVVDVTMYQPVYPQTDKTPNITADGTRIRISKASEYKFVALSRNLLKRWGGPFDYGDFILLRGTSHKDGVYQVRDTMNSKWVNMVDILESTHVKPYKFANVHIYKMPWLD